MALVVYLEMMKKCLLNLLPLLVLFGCSSTDGSDNAGMPSASPEAQEEACQLMTQYSTRGLPATYTAEAVDLVLYVADRFYAGGLPEAANAIVEELVPALEGGVVAQLQVRPLLSKISDTWCS